MVTITVFIEGGVNVNDSTDVATIDNSDALRQSLNRILGEVLSEEVSIIIEMGAGFKSTIQKFKQNPNSDFYMYVDSDNPQSSLDNWFAKLENDPKGAIHFDTDERKRIFFMIQEMESWFLKQPDAIERWAKKNNLQRDHKKEILSNHSLIKGKIIEDIVNPSQIVYTLIKHFYKSSKNGKMKKVQYGKLKSSHSLLDELDVPLLISNDSELKRFQDSI